MAGSKKYPEGKNERDIMDKVFCSASQPMGDGEKRGTLEEGLEKGIQYNEGQYFSKAKGQNMEEKGEKGDFAKEKGRETTEEVWK